MANSRGSSKTLARNYARHPGSPSITLRRINFERSAAMPNSLAANLKNYINSFRTTCGRSSSGSTSTTPSPSSKIPALLFLVTERFKNIDLHPDKVSNLEMGYVFEELIRKFNEAMDENPGEHFTPREVIRLMVNLLLTGTKTSLGEEAHRPHRLHRCCGSGGMLTIAKERILEINPQCRRSSVRPGGQP